MHTSRPVQEWDKPLVCPAAAMSHEGGPGRCPLVGEVPAATSARWLLLLQLGLLGQVLGAPPGTKPGTAPLSRLLRMKRVGFLQPVASG